MHMPISRLARRRRRPGPALRPARAGLAILLALAGCDDRPEAMPGTLEWDRIALIAEASEPVRRWAVAEGDGVTRGELLLTLDPRRLDARFDRAQGELDRARAQLDELENGTRRETLDAARADLERARAAATLAEREYQRSQRLWDQRSISRSSFDLARTQRDERRAEVASLTAQFEALTRGERPERIAAAAAAVTAARASLAELRIDRERLAIRAPRAGHVDALPFRPGDQPPLGATLVSLLVGEAPYARFFVPAGRRAALTPGDPVTVHVEGVDQPFDAHLESLASEPAFTPYYALAGDDASRLVYRAEARLEGDTARRLPAGLPVEVELVDDQ
ncbi:HlyD family secretion protein [Modicisalibacter coralii]|uniref:HlyD family secretion protein n=1 Tax=Modicisalibacter coralii TaxID=2304602 RepID=UPI001939CDBE|nr:HlyD family efflux transporter periplasmic adaptor subunit [Halomonas coralii]